MKLKSGNVVRLKTGGCKMTVEKVGEDTSIVKCVWFDMNNKLKRDSFHENMLEFLGD